MSLHQDAKAFLRNIGDRGKLQRIIDAMPPGVQCILIIRRPEDQAVAFETFGRLDSMGVSDMLDQTYYQLQGQQDTALVA